MRFSATVIATMLLAGSSALAAEQADGSGIASKDIASKDDGAFAARTRAGYIQMARLDTKGPDVRNSRDSNKELSKSDLNQVIGYYNAAIKHDPKDDDAYFHRGVAKYFAGALPQAMADLTQASKIDPTYAYYALWIDIVDKRNNAASRLSKAIPRFDMTKWPAPVIQMFLGETTPQAVLAAADDRDATIKTGQLCEANFYVGELALQQGDKTEATRLFKLAAAGCPNEFVEGPSANAELEAIGAILTP
jgi:lipoprotein NlpI